MSDCSVEGGLQSIQLPTVVAFSDTDAPLACVCVCAHTHVYVRVCVCGPPCARSRVVQVQVMSSPVG